jgi:glutamate-1-semialdehyde 2,1-aminomutase
MHAGTFNANPLCVAAAYAAVTELTGNDGAAYKHLHKVGRMLEDGLRKAIEETHTEAIVQGVGAGGCQLYFTGMKKIRNYRDFFSCDSARYLSFHKELLKRGIYFHPQQYEHLFVCTEHTTDDIEKCTNAVAQALKTLA